jgi:predicted PurR-regulated permease PerM
MHADLPTAPWFRRLLVAGLILGILLLTFSVIRPFVVPLIWGAILAYVSWPAHIRILKAVRGRNVLASGLTSALVTLIIVVPVVWLVFLLREEAASAYGHVQAFLASKPVLPDRLRQLPWIGSWTQDVLTRLSENPAAMREQFVATMEQSSVEVTRVLGGVGRNFDKMFFAIL